MRVFTIKNKNNEYLYIHEYGDIDFYDEVYLATLFENKSDAETFLQEILDKFVAYGNTYADMLCVKDYDCKVVPIEIKEIELTHQHEDKGE